MDHIIEVNGLKKNYGQVEAVRGISFHVQRGKLFSLLGPNGAGKSTTIDILCTLLGYDAGEAAIDGLDLRREGAAIRRRMGAVFQDNMLDDLLTVEENLRLRASFYYGAKAEARRATQAAAQIVGAEEFLSRPYGRLSGGQRRRADIARALLHTPKLLFLDEPTTGLDPQTRRSIWQTVRRLQRENGMTVFLTTHYMEEAEQSDYVMVIDHGRIAAAGTPGALKEQYASDSLLLYYNDRTALCEALCAQQAPPPQMPQTRPQQQTLPYTEHADHLRVKLGNTLDALPIVERYKHLLHGFEVRYGTMDDAFIGITGKELRE